VGADQSPSSGNGNNPRGSVVVVVVVVGGAVVVVVVVGGGGGAVVVVVVVAGGFVVVVVVAGGFFLTVVVVVVGAIVVVVAGAVDVVVAGAVDVVVAGTVDVVVAGGFVVVVVVVVVVGNGITRIGTVVVGDEPVVPFVFAGCVVELPAMVVAAVRILGDPFFLAPVVVVARAVDGVVVGFTVVVVTLIVVAGACAPRAGYFTCVVVVGAASEGCVKDGACPLRNKRMRSPVAASTPATTSTSHLAHWPRPARFAIWGCFSSLCS
jgi:hypothetical protein